MSASSNFFAYHKFFQDFLVRQPKKGIALRNFAQSGTPIFGTAPTKKRPERQDSAVKGQEKSRKQMIYMKKIGIVDNFSRTAQIVTSNCTNRDPYPGLIEHAKSLETHINHAFGREIHAPFMFLTIRDHYLPVPHKS